MRIKWYYLKNVFSALFIKFFGKKSEIFERCKIRNYDEKRMFSRKKKGFQLLKAFFTRIGRRKISR